MVEWGNPFWGQEGHNTHESESGSWMESAEPDDN